MRVFKQAMNMHPIKSLCAVFFFTASLALCQRDPGPQPQPVPATTYLPNMTAAELASFQEGLSRFMEIDSVAGTEPGATGTGLGPRFNHNSCAGCHAHPYTGGSSPALNPQVQMATDYGARNQLPDFIQPNGPVREARFVRNPDGTPDGGVHNLFVITGRQDAGSCNITQPNFSQAEAANNLALRIPTPLFGAGLISAISDSTILANKAASAALKKQFGIAGHENRSANDGTITRFGWKAQNKSPQIFGAEAYNVEQGVTNDIFPTERDETPGCQLNALPEDTVNMAFSYVGDISDVMGFAYFMRYLAPPAALTPTASTLRGQQVFTQTGCALCHTPSLQTGNSISAALQNQTVALFSDLLVHNMGTGLADGITQGTAQGGEFRTAPLWGLSQRLFFLHDGRTSDVQAAILGHASQGSEASVVIQNYTSLPASAKQDLLNYLRSL